MNAPVYPPKQSLRQASWRSLDVLGGLTARDLCLTHVVRADLEGLLWNDAGTEYDARFLFDHLVSRARGVSGPVRAFLEMWRQDEENHYLGLRHLLSLTTGLSCAAIDAEMAHRQPDFSPLAPFLMDEVSLLTTFAYDERVTVQAYAMDYGLYDELHPRAGRWVRLTNRDEANHYRNALLLLKALHPDKPDHVPAVLEALVAHDERRDPYSATFLLDHDDGGLYFTDKRLRKCARIIERHLKRHPPPAAQ